MKVLHVISGGETGGSRKHVITLLQQYSREEVCLVLFQDGPFAQEAIEKGLRVEIIKQSSRYDISILKRLRMFIDSEGFNIIHSHGPRANLFISFIKKKMDAVWVTTVHSDPKLDFMKGGIKGKLFTSLNLWALKQIDYYFAVTDLFKRNLIHLGIPEKKIFTIYNGIEFIEPIAGDGALQKELGLSADDFIMTMVARLHPIKGHSIVFKALKELDNEHIHLVLVGDGPIAADLKEEVQKLGLVKQVHFLGFRKDIDQIYSNSNIALLASYSESFPLALLEGANQKRSLISTNVGGVKQLIPSEEYGWIVPIDDAQAYQKAIEQAYESFENHSLEEKGEKLYEFARDHFSLKHLADKVKDDYDQILNQR
ncbi:glycosyltransferase family 4 protein [Bacillus sp. 1P06AnD]|uniref:glycosyltransferase family 4 protein n=1 Tax=Bacillus sp. 1P06AnD TaxID=3132208 RepID=UPI00399F0376